MYFEILNIILVFKKSWWFLLEPIENLQEFYDLKAGFIREQIDIQVESLKNEIDNIRDCLFRQLDAHMGTVIEYFNISRIN